MLTTDVFTFGRDGVITFFRSVNQKELKRIWRMCIAHARTKHIKKPYNWRFVPTLEVA